MSFESHKLKEGKVLLESNTEEAKKISNLEKSLRQVRTRRKKKNLIMIW